MRCNRELGSFRVVADLRKVKEGTVEVPLIVEDLPAGLTATVEPQKSFCKNREESEKNRMQLEPRSRIIKFWMELR